MDTEQIYEGHCEDIHGNKYKESYTTTSCCECLMYVKIVKRLGLGLGLGIGDWDWGLVLGIGIVDGDGNGDEKWE